MKWAFSFYRTFISPALITLGRSFGLGLFSNRVCRHPVSCSRYAEQALLEHGWLRGGLMAASRLSSCHPFSHKE